VDTVDSFAKFAPPWKTELDIVWLKNYSDSVVVEVQDWQRGSDGKQTTKKY